MASKHFLLLVFVCFHHVLWLDFSRCHQWRIPIAHFIFRMRTILGSFTSCNLWMGEITTPGAERWWWLNLTTKNKVSFVDGTIPRVTANNLLFNAWTCCNSMVVSWLPLKEVSASPMHSQWAPGSYYQRVL